MWRFRHTPGQGSGDEVYLAALFHNDPELRHGPWCWRIERREIVRFARQVLSRLDDESVFEERVLRELKELKGQIDEILRRGKPG